MEVCNLTISGIPEEDWLADDPLLMLQRIIEQLEDLHDAAQTNRSLENYLGGKAILIESGVDQVTMRLKTPSAWRTKPNE